MKEIKTMTVKACDLKTGFGNPRKIKRQKREELRQSLEQFGDFGIFLIDENMNLIAGNQRWSVIMEMDPNRELLCKQLIGYTNAELRAINIKDNTHSGEWDLDLLADWTADLNVDLGLGGDEKDLADRSNKEMELINFEKYNYVVLVCRNELDYTELLNKLKLDDKAVVKINDKHKLKARAIWYDGKQL